MARKKRGNDAIPTWSGFNYQGKVTLLAAFMEINYLLSKKIEITDAMYIEIEKTEDFIIYIDNKVKSLNQVKAWLSTNKYSSYMSAIEKLLSHRREIKATKAICNLCVPIEIVDWNDVGNKYKSSIEIYKYNNSCIGLEQAPILIKDEIKKTMKFLGFSSYDIDNIYLELCEYLDNIVSNMHLEGIKNRNYKIFMNDILENIKSCYDQGIKSSNAKEKEKVYEHIVINLKETIDNYCKKDCDNNESCIYNNELNGSCSLYKSYDYILNINFWEYLKCLNPHISEGWDKIYNYVERLNMENFKNLLIPVILQINEDMLLSDGQTVYCETDIYKTQQKKVIPTMLSFYSGIHNLSKKEKSIQEKLEKIKQNKSIYLYITGSTITTDTNGYQFNTESDSILYFDKSEEGNISNLEDYIKIVDSRDFIERLGN